MFKLIRINTYLEMKRLRIFLLSIVSLFFIRQGINAQVVTTFKFGKISVTDFDVKPFTSDSNANALIIADIGSSEFVANANQRRFEVIFSEAKRIKIINKNGLSIASVSIPVYVNDKGLSEQIVNLKAYTYNIVDGKIVTTKLESKSIFSEKRSKNWTIKKFTFPSVTEGSIIEYTYDINSPFLFNLHSWEFQSEYPCLWSEYKAAVPEFFEYIHLTQGYQPFAENKEESIQQKFVFKDETTYKGDGAGAGWEQKDELYQGKELFDFSGVVTTNTWAMHKIPALKEEPYTTTINNHLSKIEFQLSKIKYPQSPAIRYMTNWVKTAEDLMNEDNFGIQINRPNIWLQDEVKKIIKNANTPLEKAYLIYKFISNKFICTNHNAITTSDLLKETYKKFSGNVADINLLLIAMLRVEKIESDPIILSTRSNGLTSGEYPLIDRFNYLIVSAKIDGNYYNLDASVPGLGFGHLSVECYNGHARIIKKEMAYPTYFYSDSLKDASQTTVIIANDEKDGFVGGVSTNISQIKSYDLRKDLLKLKETDYAKSYLGKLDDEIVIENFSIDSLTKFEEPISIKYDMKFKMFDKAEIVYFNPLLGKEISKNPFSSQTRLYPVEMPYTKDYVYNLTMDIPKGYIVDEIPKSVRTYLNENEGVFDYIIKNFGDHIQLTCRLAIYKTVFDIDNYENLRNFYSQVVQKEAEKIVFKKSK